MYGLSLVQCELCNKFVKYVTKKIEKRKENNAV